MSVENICTFCHKQFLSRRHVSLYCSNTCQTSYSKKRMSQKGYIPWYKQIRRCVVCFKDFRPSSPSNKFCGQVCKVSSMSGQSRFLKLRFEVFKRDNFSCVYCGRSVKEDKIKLQCDHVIPRSKNGKDTLDNLVTACAECNRGKSDVLLIDVIKTKLHD